MKLTRLLISDARCSHKAGCCFSLSVDAAHLSVECGPFVLSQETEIQIYQVCRVEVQLLRRNEWWLEKHRVGAPPKKTLQTVGFWEFAEGVAVGSKIEMVQQKSVWRVRN